MDRPKQDLEVILSECEEMEKVWTDPDFPTVKKSLCPPNEQISKTWDCEVEWIRATKLPSLTDEEGDIRIFSDELVPGNLSVGSLNDTYFLSVLGCISEKPERIRKLFLVDEPNEWGVYGV